VSDGPTLIEQAFRYELDVSAEQRKFLDSCLGASRFWFNQGLALVKARLDERVEDEDVRVPWSYHPLCSAFRGDQVKDEIAPWRSEVVIGSDQAGLEALGSALQAFSRVRSSGRKVGFARFRSKHNPAHQSAERVLFQNPRIPDARHVMLDRRLGPIRAKESLRKLTRLIARDPEARILRATVKRSSDGDRDRVHRPPLPGA
jgi:putative transposase